MLLNFIETLALFYREVCSSRTKYSIVTLLVVFIVLGLVLSGCGQATKTSSGTASSESSVIKFGVTTPMSAPGDVKSGEININTLKLAQKEINDQGGINGKKVELVIGDDAGNSAKGVSLVQKFITEDKVSAILGAWHGSVAQAQSKVAADNKVPFLLHYSWPDEITAMHSDYIFRVSPYNSQIAQLLTPFIKEHYKNVAVMAEDSAFGTGIADALKAQGEKNGFNVTTRVFPSSSMDLSPQLLELKNLNPRPDLLLIASVYQPMYIIPKQAKEVGLTPGTQLMAAWDYPSWDTEFWKTAGEGGKGILYPAFYYDKMNLSDLGKHFKEAYAKEYKQDPPIYAYFLYDEFQMLVDVIKKTGSADPQTIAKELKNIKFAGTTGEITFSSEDKPGPVWNQWLGHQLFIMKLNNVGDMGDKAELIYSK